MKKWSKQFEKCQNCKSVRFNHIARGYCAQCYRLVKKLELVELWNLSDIKTLKGYSRETLFRQPDVFKKVKAGFISQIKERLDCLKGREEILASPIFGIDIEYQLQRIAGQCGVRSKNLLHGIAGYIDQNFSMEQKKILYELLNQIEENIPWCGINWYKIFTHSI